MTDKEQAQQRKREEDTVFNRMLLWLAGAVVLELLMLLLKRVFVDLSLGGDVALALGSFFGVFQIAGSPLTIVCALWLAFWLRADRNITLPAVCTGVFAILWVVSILCRQFYDLGVRVLLVLPAAAAVLILIYFLYQRTFFVSSVLVSGGAAALWLFRSYYADHPLRVTLCFAAGWVVLAVAAVLSWRLSKSGGMLGSLRVMPEDSMYAVLYITCGLTAAAMALGFLLGSAVAYYLIFALAAWLFGQAVFFTVKLM